MSAVFWSRVGPLHPSVVSTWVTGCGTGRPPMWAVTGKCGLEWAGWGSPRTPRPGDRWSGRDERQWLAGSVSRRTRVAAPGKALVKGLVFRDRPLACLAPGGSLIQAAVPGGWGQASENPRGCRLLQPAPRRPATWGVLPGVLTEHRRVRVSLLLRYTWNNRNNLSLAKVLTSESIIQRLGSSALKKKEFCQGTRRVFGAQGLRVGYTTTLAFIGRLLYAGPFGCSGHCPAVVWGVPFVDEQR